MEFFRFTLAAVFALLAFTFCPGSVKADAITTFQATGALQGGTSVSGTLTIDTTTGTLVNSAITVAADSFSAFDVTSTSNETTISSTGGGFPILRLQLPVSTLTGYTGGWLGSFAHPVITNGLRDYSSLYFGSSISMYLTNGALTPVTATPEIPTFAMIGIGLLLLTLGLLRKHGRILRKESYGGKTAPAID